MAPMSKSLDNFARDKLDVIAARNLTRRLIPTVRGSSVRAARGAECLISFCDNDYLGLSQHPQVIAAAVKATEAHGAGAGASRLVTGNHPLYDALESRLARLKGTEAACVFGSGYLANIGIIPAFAGQGDLVLGDELMHACMNGGAKLSGAETHVFRHNDVADCERLLKQHRAGKGHCLILTEGVFSMDGDRAPVAELAALAHAYDAWLLVDDAHALGVINGGRGSGFDDAGGRVGVDLAMGTLSKSAGAYGGYVAASRTAIDYLINRARSLIYTTGLPPGVLAAAEKALELIETDAALTAKPLAHARTFTQGLGLPNAVSAVVALVLGDEARALKASDDLARQGFLVTAIRPPTVPPGTARLRVTFSAAHANDDVERFIAAVKALNLVAEKTPA
ncbi:MAG: 8-amino-7-oxononanoate synthase [Alphaproteobacteria bacterium]|jgi:8-amino-7-oxononanoate synthase